MPGTGSSTRERGSGDGALRRLWRELGPRSSSARSTPRPEPTHSTGAADTIGVAPLRVPVALSGTITMVTINPRGVNRWLEAVLDDGTGEVLLIWMGRRLVRGIDAGRRLDVTGTITLFDGHKAIYNPNYSLRP